MGRSWRYVCQQKEDFQERIRKGGRGKSRESGSEKRARHHEERTRAGLKGRRRWRDGWSRWKSIEAIFGKSRSSGNRLTWVGKRQDGEKHRRQREKRAE